MDREKYFERKRDLLVKSYLSAEGEYKTELLRRIINLDSETGYKDSFGKKEDGHYTLKRKKIIYVN